MPRSRIIKDINKLAIPCKKVKTFKEGEIIAKKLFKVLSKSKNGIGLAANQIGINKEICVINIPYDNPLWLMNPVYIGGFESIIFQESCLSFPDVTITTKRFKNIIVKADNFNRELTFGSPDILKCICIQHEISHLKGKTMFDYEYKVDNNE